ncbi:hypothetical protein, partial [Serratia marcescens]|uniref:hypothetical protein n=1 Tax=Serratia marcescens TaxID=615 RepID=UPI001952E264
VEASLPASQRAFAAASGFAPKAGRLALLPDAEGGLARVLSGLGDTDARGYDRFLTGKLPGLLPAGDYALEPEGIDA